MKSLLESILDSSKYDGKDVILMEKKRTIDEWHNECCKNTHSPYHVSQSGNVVIETGQYYITESYLYRFNELGISFECDRTEYPRFEVDCNYRPVSLKCLPKVMDDLYLKYADNVSDLYAQILHELTYYNGGKNGCMLKNSKIKFDKHAKLIIRSTEDLDFVINSYKNFANLEHIRIADTGNLSSVGNMNGHFLDVDHLNEEQYGCCQLNHPIDDSTREWLEEDIFSKDILKNIKMISFEHYNITYGDINIIFIKPDKCKKIDSDSAKKLEKDSFYKVAFYHKNIDGFKTK